MPRSDHEPLVGIHLGALRGLPASDLLVRFGFGAAISAVAGLVSVFAGSEPGGILLAFPAILPATLTLIEKEESERQAEDLDVGSILGAAALAAFAIVVWQYMDGGNPPVVLALATGAWLLTAMLLYLGLHLIVMRQNPLDKTIAQLRAGQHP
jgi:uncharacterized membrane protein (GlpM family)